MKEATKFDLENCHTINWYRMCVKDGSIIDYDGHGFYGNLKEKSDIFFDFTLEEIDEKRKEFTHVYWYNK